MSHVITQTVFQPQKDINKQLVNGYTTTFTSEKPFKMSITR